MKYTDSENTKTFMRADKIAQGVFEMYFTTEDDNVDAVRNGGFGSTGE